MSHVISGDPPGGAAGNPPGGATGTPPGGAMSPQLFHVSYDATQEERDKLEPADLAQMNIDLPAVVAVILGVVPRITEARPEVAAALPQTDLTRYDRIAVYAEAASHAHGVFLIASDQSALPAIVADGTAQRDMLHSDLSALVNRGLVDGKVLNEVKKGTGYLQLASDLNALVKVFRANWGTIGSRTAVTLAELDAAELLYQRLTVAYAERTQPSPAATDAADQRQRAFTLLANAYDQVRRAISYLRWDARDVDKIVPSIYAGRGGRSSKADASAPADAPPEPGPKPGTAPGPAIAAPAAGSHDQGAAHEAPPVGAGPGGSPFSN